MKKIPVGQTIAFAYRFLISEIATIVGLTWIPALIAAVAGYFAQYYGISHSALLEAGDTQTGAAYLAITVASLAVMGFASLRFMAGTTVLLALAAGITAFAFVLAGVPLNTPAQAQPTPAALLAGLISWVVFVYAFVTILRMGFLLPPVIVAEEKGGLRRAHDLTKGNFWRMFAVMLALGLPVLALLLAGEGVVLRSALGPNIANLSPAEFMDKAEQAMNEKLLPWTIFTTVVFILGSGLVFSGTAFAYRAVAENSGELPALRRKQ